MQRVVPRVSSNASSACTLGGCVRAEGITTLTAVQVLAVRRQADLSCGAVEQLDAQRRLQAGHALGQRGRRTSQFADTRGIQRAVDVGGSGTNTAFQGDLGRELCSAFAYLKSQPPVRNAVPDYQPPAAAAGKP